MGDRVLTDKPNILGIGGPILDMVIQVSSEYLNTLPGEKRGMMAIDFPTMVKIIDESGVTPISMLGGCTRNVLRGMTCLGEKCAFLGMIGKDDIGQKVRHLLGQQGIYPLLIESTSPTAIVLSLVTPDGERTMRTFQGASIEIRGKDLTPELFKGMRLVHIEGYALYNEDLVERAMQLAQDAGAKISFDLASFEIVRQFRPHVLHLLDNYVDIIFCNEEESLALTGKSPEETCDILAELCEVAIVLLGNKGCWVKRGHRKERCPAYPVEPVDTTGAGDLFASGFLHAYIQGSPICVCAHYGAVTGRAVVQTIGAEIPHSAWPEIRSQFTQSQT